MVVEDAGAKDKEPLLRHSLRRGHRVSVVELAGCHGHCPLCVYEFKEALDPAFILTRRRLMLFIARGGGREVKKAWKTLIPGSN